MTARALPVALVVASLLVDGRPASYLLLVAVPAAAIAALHAFGELVELPGRAPGVGAARFRAVLAGLGLVLVLVAAGAQGHANAPALAASAAVAFLLVAGAQAASATLRLQR